MRSDTHDKDYVWCHLTCVCVHARSSDIKIKGIETIKKRETCNRQKTNTYNYPPLLPRAHQNAWEEILKICLHRIYFRFQHFFRTICRCCRLRLSIEISFLANHLHLSFIARPIHVHEFRIKNSLARHPHSNTHTVTNSAINFPEQNAKGKNRKNPI